MYKLFTSCLIASLLLAACNSGSGKKSSSAAAPAPLPGVTAAPGTNQPPPVITTNAAPATGSAAAGTNPPHGQPGHRCDLAVGAPLNGAPAPSMQVPTGAQKPNMTIQPQATPVTMPAPSNSGGARINPPHGQPGHDCSVQVGQPLPSKK
ncbi:MAG TPA: hypothetical protein VGE66_05905 [Chitinophagaceae bacterium]